MGEMPQNRRGIIPMLVAIRIAGERKRREAEAEAARADQRAPAEPPKKKKKRGWFG